MASQKQLNELEELRRILMPVLGQAAIGNFDSDLPLDPDNPREVNEILMGVQVLLEVIREKVEQLEAANAQLQEAQKRSVDILDEVLRRSLD